MLQSDNEEDFLWNPNTSSVESFPVFCLLTGLCDEGQCGIIFQSCVFCLGPLNNEPHPRHKFIASKSM